MMTESWTVLSWEVVDLRGYNDAPENLWGDGYIQYFDCDPGFTYTCVKTYQIVPFKYVRLLYVNYTVNMFKYMCIAMCVCISYVAYVV